MAKRDVGELHRIHTTQCIVWKNKTEAIIPEATIDLRRIRGNSSRDERQTDKQTDRQIDIQTARQREKERVIQSPMQTRHLQMSAIVCIVTLAFNRVQLNAVSRFARSIITVAQHKMYLVGYAREGVVGLIEDEMN